MAQTECNQDACTAPAHARGMCKRHYSAAYMRERRTWQRASKQCKVDGCGAPVHAYGLCASHRERCSLEGCGAPAKARGLCEKHYGTDYARTVRSAARADRPERACDHCGELIPRGRRLRGESAYCSVQCKGKHYTALGKNAEKQRAFHYRHRYGLTVEQATAMVDAGCQICGAQQDTTLHGGRLHIDHDHKTGIVRGALCSSCNLGLGKFKDDPALLRAAIEYLGRASAP
jgi:hypothetical protein